MSMKKVWDVPVSRIDTRKVTFAPITIRVRAESAEAARAIIATVEDLSEEEYNWDEIDSEIEIEDLEFDVENIGHIKLSSDQNSQPDLG